MVFDKIKRAWNSSNNSTSEDYVEIDLGQEKKRAKISVQPFVLKKFDDVNLVLNSLREGYTIAVIDIKDLRKKDVIELKRAVAKIKKTTEALEGSIRGFGENIIIATPQFAEISVPAFSQPQEKSNSSKFDTY
jgi:SepF-like predicted cell division protein (DUF552 family)